MIIVKHSGSFKNTENFLQRIRQKRFLKKLEQYGQMGVQALSEATPVDTGKTASSWGYEVNASDTSYTIAWTNSNTNKGVPIALVIQYGHAMPNGGYVEGRDYINPALKPIFDQILEDVWKEVIDA